MCTTMPATDVHAPAGGDVVSSTCRFCQLCRVPCLSGPCSRCAVRSENWLLVMAEAYVVSCSCYLSNHSSCGGVLCTLARVRLAVVVLRPGAAVHGSRACIACFPLLLHPPWPLKFRMQSWHAVALMLCVSQRLCSGPTARLCLFLMGCVFNDQCRLSPISV